MVKRKTQIRLHYAEYIFKNRSVTPTHPFEKLGDFALWRGLMFKPDRTFQAGSTQADVELMRKMLRAGNDAISETNVETSDEMIDAPDQYWPDHDPALDEEADRETFVHALASVPPRSSQALGASCRKTPAFFRANHRPAQFDAAELDSGVALLVKTLPLVGVSSWRSCDGHHLLGRTPKTSVKPATIEMVEMWDALWLAGLLKLAQRTIDLHCDWRLRGISRSRPRLMVAAPKNLHGLHQRAFAQDSDMQTVARWFLQGEVNEAIRDVKRPCERAKPSDRLRTFHQALFELEALRY